MNTPAHPLEDLARTGCWFCPRCERAREEPREAWHGGGTRFCPECAHALEWIRPWLGGAEHQGGQLKAEN